MTYYDDISEGYDELHKHEQLNKLKIILDHLPEIESILDVGAGTGFSLDYIKAKRKVALDPSKELLKKCKYETVVGKAESLPFKDNEFDAVISLTALHHCDYIKKAVDEIDRVAKKFIALTILKKTSKFSEIKATILNKWPHLEEFSEEKDIIFLINN